MSTSQVFEDYLLAVSTATQLPPIVVTMFRFWRRYSPREKMWGIMGGVIIVGSVGKVRRKSE